MNVGWIGMISTIVAIITVIIAIVGSCLAVQRYNNTGRSKIYAHMSACETKLTDKIDKDFVRKEVCDITHKHVENELREIKKQTALIPGIAAQLQTLVRNGHGTGGVG